ncbi:MAG: hypothetical protein ACQEQM_05985 [Thermoplasmatota archaeon]
MKDLIEKYFDTPDKKAKLYLLITIAQIWAVIAIVIGIIVFIFVLLRNMGIL